MLHFFMHNIVKILIHKKLDLKYPYDIVKTLCEYYTNLMQIDLYFKQYY